MFHVRDRYDLPSVIKRTLCGQVFSFLYYFFLFLLIIVIFNKPSFEKTGGKARNAQNITASCASTKGELLKTLVGNMRRRRKGRGTARAGLVALLMCSFTALGLANGIRKPTYTFVVGVVGGGHDAVELLANAVVPDAAKAAGMELT